MADVMDTINKVKTDATDVLDTVQDKVAELVDELSAKVKDVLGDLPEIKALEDLPNARTIAEWSFDTAEDILGKQKEFTFKLIDAVQPEVKKAAKKAPAKKKTTAKKPAAKAAA